MGKKEDQIDEDGPISPELYKILVCPVTKEPLKYSKDKKWLISVKSKQKYPIRGKVPILLPNLEQ